FTDDLDFFVAATMADGVTEAEAREAIESVTDEFPQVRLQTAEEFRASQEGELDTVLVVVNVFLLFAVLIAGIGIANTLALWGFERTVVLGLLRAMGETKRQVRSMVTLEAVPVAIFGAVLGVLIGLGFGVATVTAMPDSFVSQVDIPWGMLVGVL